MGTKSNKKPKISKGNEKNKSKNNFYELFYSGGGFQMDSHYYSVIVNFSCFPEILETSATGGPPGG